MSIADGVRGMVLNITTSEISILCRRIEKVDHSEIRLLTKDIEIQIFIRKSEFLSKRVSQVLILSLRPLIIESGGLFTRDVIKQRA